MTLSPESQATTMFDTVVSDFQEDDIEVVGNKITGTLKYLATGSPAATYGAGYFIALKWSNLDSDTRSLKVGIMPSEGTGMIECYSDLDRNGYFKVTNKNLQQLVFRQADTSGNVTIQRFDISGLTLAPQA